jgi:geranylgeranyl reductase
MLRTEVLVIGGGPAGSTAARFLARNGVDTLLVERNFSFVKPCGGGIPSFLLQEMGLPEYPVKRFVDTLKVVSPKGDILTIPLKGGSIAIVERGEFDHVLRKEAERSGARLLQGEFRRFIDLGRTVTAEIATSPELSCSGLSLPRTIHVEADYVIAADGVNSRVRTAMGIKSPPSFLTLSEKVQNKNADVCEFWFGTSHAPRCYSWVFPHREGVSVGTATLEHARITQVWKKFVERTGLHTSGPQRGYKIPLWQGDLYHSGRVVFVGDAAGQVMPSTYEGIYYAMKAGELASSAIANRKIGEYKKLWEKGYGKRFLLMKKLWAYFMSSDRRLEKMVELHKNPEVQEASMNLWLRKDPGKGSLLTFIKIFRKFLS